MAAVKPLPSRQPPQPRPRLATDQLLSEWYQHLGTPEERDAFKSRVVACSDVLEVLRNIIQKRYDAQLTSRVSDYSTPNWEVVRAHKDGMVEAYEEVVKFLP